MTLSMSKLLKKTLLVSSIISTTVYAAQATLLEKYLTDQLKRNPIVKETKIKIVSKEPLRQIKGWNAYIVEISAKVKDKKIRQSDIFFSNGTFIAPDFIDMRSKTSLKLKIKPTFKHKYYKDENLLFGSKASKHKVAIFSDPLCPFCRNFVPNAIKEMQKDPKKYALYYYHLPLERLHPASVVLVKALIAAKLKGEKADIMNLYTKIQPDNPKKKYYVNYKEKDTKKILKVFNEAMHTDITPKDIDSKEVQRHLNSDLNIANKLLVNGTPSVYFDGKYDNSKEKYKKAK